MSQERLEILELQHRRHAGEDWKSGERSSSESELKDRMTIGNLQYRIVSVGYTQPGTTSRGV